jgi:choice-of-anchor C domain-containing protein
VHRIGRKAAAAAGVAGLSLVALAPSALAANSTLVNPSFEDFTTGQPYFTVTAANEATYLGPAWKIVPRNQGDPVGNVDLVNDSYWQAYDGHQSVDLSGDTPGVLAQTIATTIGHQYQLSFAYTGNPDGPPVTHAMNVRFGADGNQQFDVPSTGESHTNMLWRTATLTFTATQATEQIRFADLDSPATYYGPVIDAVSVTDLTAPVAALPEARTPALLGLAGMVAFGGTAYLRRRRTA